MTDTRACPKRDRMTEIRQQRRDAGFSEVNVWVPDEHARAFRDLAWLFVDYSGRNLPFRGLRRHNGADPSDLKSVLSAVLEGSK